MTFLFRTWPRARGPIFIAGVAGFFASTTRDLHAPFLELIWTLLGLDFFLSSGATIDQWQNSDSRFQRFSYLLQFIFSFLLFVVVANWAGFIHPVNTDSLKATWVKISLLTCLWTILVLLLFAILHHSRDCLFLTDVGDALRLRWRQFSQLIGSTGAWVAVVIALLFLWVDHTYPSRIEEVLGWLAPLPWFAIVLIARNFASDGARQWLRRVQLWDSAIVHLFMALGLIAAGTLYKMFATETVFVFPEGADVFWFMMNLPRFGQAIIAAVIGLLGTVLLIFTALINHRRWTSPL